MSEFTYITLAILAGGEGSRLGKPKALLRVNNRTVLDYLLDRLSWPGPTMLVTCPGRERPPGAARFDREVVDPAAGVGPLRGILTALQHASTPLVVVTAVDMPLVESAHLQEIVRAIRARPTLVGLLTRQNASPEDTSGVRTNMRTISLAQRIQPFPGVFHLNAGKILRERLESRQFSVVALTRHPRFAAVQLGWNPDVWLNVNTPADLERFRAHQLVIE